MLWKGFQRPKRLDVDREGQTGRFGRFTAQPFERGWGTTIGKVTLVEPTEHGARAEMSIDSQFKIPVDTTASVHSVSLSYQPLLPLCHT